MQIIVTKVNQQRLLTTITFVNYKIMVNNQKQVKI